MSLGAEEQQQQQQQQAAAAWALRSKETRKKQETALPSSLLEPRADWKQKKIARDLKQIFLDDEPKALDVRDRDRDSKLLKLVTLPPIWWNLQKEGYRRHRRRRVFFLWGEKKQKR